MPSLRISLSFRRLADAALGTFTTGVIDGMTDNAAYPAPFVPLADLATANQAYRTALVNCAQGGTAFTALKNELRTRLVDLLRQQAGYVQTACGGELSVLLSSGFQAASTNRTSSPVSRPIILQISNPREGQLGLRLQPVPNARGYQARCSTDGTTWQDAGIYPNTRLVLTDLTPGQRYNVQVRAIGGSTRYSDWSDPQSRRVM
jgi:hypothetical protein